jgi:hypothetical protein
MNQALAGLGALTFSVAILFWSFHLSRLSVLAWATGVLGLALGAAPAIAYLTGALQVNVAGALTTYAAQGVWSLAAGGLLVSKKV